jgi:putative ATP-binding cassette transporter
LLDATVTLLSFIGILWSLSGGFSFSLSGEQYNIPGFMVWMALVYALSGSLIGHFIGKSMASLNFAQQRYEADFRHHLMRVREYSEAIALDRGSAVERSALLVRFKQVLNNFMLLLRVQKRYTWFNSGYGQAAVVFPMLVAAPRYFSGAIQLGELMQISSAFGQVQESLSWFITNYSRLASWQATTLRLTGFQDQMLAVSNHDASALTNANTSIEHSVNSIDTPPLTISLPNGTVLLHNTRLQVQAGDTVLVRGPSGCGKSTLFRTLAGIWPHVTTQDATQLLNSLHIALPDHTVFMPQRPYFPQGSLRQALAYPSPAELFDDAQLKQVLHDSLLPHLADQLDAQGQWTQQLSGGEQQRLAIARVLLKRSRWVFADEITSALDASAEQALYEKLLQLVREQQGALVSIAHRPGVAAFHQQQWVFTPNDVDASTTSSHPQAAFTLSSAAIL